MIKNLDGLEVGKRMLDPKLFDLPRNDALVHQVFVVLSGNERTPLAHTKDRGERAGTGKKPWKQKGTGRARAGSVRSPLWRKGGITFGPTRERNYVRELPSKMRQKAVLVALSEKRRQGKWILVDTLAVKDLKTKLAAQALSKLSITPKSAAIVMLTDEKPKAARAFRNIPRTSLIHTPDLNVLDLLRSEYILMSEQSCAALEQRFRAWTSSPTA